MKCNKQNDNTYSAFKNGTAEMCIWSEDSLIIED